VTTGAYIAIAGNIGSGKSSFVRFVQSRFHVQAVDEPNDSNPFLAPFYEDMSRWAFHSQCYFLAAKAALHRTIEGSSGHIVQDRTLWEDAEIFAEQLARTGKMSADEHQVYRSLYEGVSRDLRPPDLLVYLRCPVRTLRRRIQSRGRAMEMNVPTPYLQALHKLYEGWYDAYALGPKLVYNTRDFDPVTDLVDCHIVLDQLAVHLG